jgi:predicted HTH domain antitoxin
VRDVGTTVYVSLEGGSGGSGDTSVRVAAERYQSGEVSVNQTARLAGVGLGEWLEVARKRNLTSQLTPDDLKADADAARDL